MQCQRFYINCYLNKSISSWRKQTSFTRASVVLHQAAHNYNLINIAFNNIWWPAFLYQLREAGYSTNLYEFLTRLLSTKKIRIWKESSPVIKRNSIDCPQFSTLEPLLWHILCNTAFRLDLRKQIYLQSYYVKDFSRKSRWRNRHTKGENWCAWKPGARMSNFISVWRKRQYFFIFSSVSVIFSTQNIMF